MSIKEQLHLYQNYIIIAILSAISVFFLPMLGSTIGMGFIVPNTVAGWIVYIATKLSIVIINVLIFDQFIKQAKVNIKDDPRYLEAERILFKYLMREEVKEEIIPTKQRIARMYRNKAITTVIFTILGVFGFTQAILTFDWVQMLSYAFTIGVGIVFGWISMNEAEIIWTEDHLKYAKYLQQKEEAAKTALPAVVQESEEVAAPQYILQRDDIAGVTG